MFYNTLGTSFVPAALNAARPADPNAKLYINDYNIEYTGLSHFSILCKAFVYLFMMAW